MSQFRRQDDRRRRVLMSTASATAASPGHGSRSRLESMREARRPTLVYGTRVRQGLRGRWFSLVPVDRAALVKLVAVLAAIVLAIVVMNDATVRFSTIQSRPAFVDVFQINRLGSLGRYVIGLMYLATAGAAWMVYQLRRFRNDDFRGNYRLWQWVVGVCMFASVATLVPLLAMLGATVEALMGRRIALSGHDWVGLFLVVGGAVLALRTIAEMSRHRASLAALIGGWCCAAIPVAAQWNMIAINSNWRWSIVTSAPLLAVMLWLIASISYLRTLYREVRGIEPSMGFFQRLRDSVPRPFASRQADARSDSPSPSERAPERGVARKTPAAKLSSPTVAPVKATPVKSASSDGGAGETKKRESETPRGKRRWFGLLPPAKSDDGDSPEKPKAPTPSKSRAAQVAAVPEDDDDENSEDYSKNDAERTSRAKQPEPSEPQPTKRRFGLGSLMKRKSVAEPESGDATGDRSQSPTPPSPSTAASKVMAKSAGNSEAKDDDDDDGDEEGDEEGFDDDGVDWSSMNKAERRRMRKQLKRGGKAA